MIATTFSETGWRGAAKLAAAALCIALMSGCTMLRLGYGQIDTYAAWAANDYFELNQEQRTEFDRRFDQLHDWHRYEQLPDYATFLGSTRARLQKGMSRDDVLWVMEGVKERYRTLVRHGADDAAAMLMTVTPAQIDALKRRWEKDNQRFVREYRLKEGPRERREASLDRLYKRISEWTGNLTHEQEQKIAALVDEGPFIHALRYEDRLRRQREFLQLLAGRGTDARAFADRLRNFLSNWEQGRSPEYARQYREWEQKQADIYVAVEKMLTPPQRASVVRRLDGHISDFTQLARRTDARPDAASNAPASRGHCCGEAAK